MYLVETLEDVFSLEVKNPHAQAYVTQITLIDNSWFDNTQSIGVTADASAPEVLAQSVITTLEKLFETTIITSEKATENVRFQLPKELQIANSK